MDNEFIELNAIARDEGKEYPKKRLIYQTIMQFLPERIFIALVGPRGSGKTVMLKQILCETESSFYVSLDTQKPEKGLFSLAKKAEESGLKILLLDEVHTYPNFEMEIKKIHDFLSIQVIFTSSSAILIQKSAHDLSRRVRLLQVFPFSFREFFYFEKNELLPTISFNALLDENSSREYYGKTIHAEAFFERYLRGENYPFALGKSKLNQIFRNILETIINRDLILTGLATPEEAMDIRKLMAFIGNSSAEGISYSSISKNLGFTKYKAEKYTGFLEKAFVLKRIMPKGSNVMKEPKILIALPYRLLYKNYEECIGALREDFFTDSMKYFGFELNYLKSRRGKKMPDYVVNGIITEIGGASKGASQFKGFVSKKKLIFSHLGKVDKMHRPLFFAGMIE